MIDIDVAIKQYAEEEGIDEGSYLNSDFVNAVIGQGKHENQSSSLLQQPKGCHS